MRRALVTPATSSYASVVSGQSRVPAIAASDPHHSAPGSNRFNSTSSTFAQKLPQLPPIPQPLPHYLKDSAYAERLSQHAKLQQAKSPSFTSLPTPPSSLTLPGRLPAVHRGIAFDVVESLPIEDEPLSPLPTRFNEADKCVGIELLNDGSEAKFVGIKPYFTMSGLLLIRNRAP